MYVLISKYHMQNRWWTNFQSLLFIQWKVGLSIRKQTLRKKNPGYAFQRTLMFPVHCCPQLSFDPSSLSICCLSISAYLSIVFSSAIMICCQMVADNINWDHFLPHYRPLSSAHALGNVPQWHCFNRVRLQIVTASTVYYRSNRNSDRLKFHDYILSDCCMKRQRRRKAGRKKLSKSARAQPKVFFQKQI